MSTSSFVSLQRRKKGELCEKGISLIELPSLEVEKRVDVLQLPKKAIKKLRKAGLLRIRDLLDRLESLPLNLLLTPSEQKALRSDLDKRRASEPTLCFENRKLLVLLLTEITVCSSQEIDCLSDNELVALSAVSVSETKALSSSIYVTLVRWLESVLQSVTNHLLVPWLNNRGGIGTPEEIFYWMSMRSEAPQLNEALSALLIKGFMWDRLLWGPYLIPVKLIPGDQAIWYVTCQEKVFFLRSLFELLNSCFYKRGQFYRFEYILRLVQKSFSFDQEVGLRDFLVRLFASIPGLRMIRTSEGLSIEKVSSGGFFLDR